MSQEKKKQYSTTVGFIKENKSGKGRHVSVRESMSPGTYVLVDPFKEIDFKVQKGWLDSEVAEERKAKLKDARVFMTIDKLPENQD